MADYDYSPETYDRYILAQRRIAQWVNITEARRPEFDHPVVDPQERVVQQKKRNDREVPVVSKKTKGGTKGMW